MRSVLAMTAGIALALAGCSGVPLSDPSAGSIRDVTIGAGPGGVPTIEYDPGLHFTRAQTRVEWNGDGEVLREGDPLLLDIYAVSLDSGDLVRDTYSSLPTAYLLAPELVGDDLFDALVGRRVGSRIVHIAAEAPGYEDLGAVAMVIDVLPRHAVGRPTSVDPNLPIVIQGDYGEPIVTFRAEDEAPLPTDLTARTLIDGTGEQVRTGSLVLLNYMVLSATTHEVVYTSWDLNEAPWQTQVGVGEIPTGLDISLIDVRAGSQIIVVAPPIYAYGDDTLVFVVDVLAVRNSE